jgi:hypothetical protein
LFYRIHNIKLYIQMQNVCIMEQNSGYMIIEFDGVSLNM